MGYLSAIFLVEAEAVFLSKIYVDNQFFDQICRKVLKEKSNKASIGRRMDKIHFLILISLTVMVSGCTSQTTDVVPSTSSLDKDYKYTYSIEEDVSVEESREIAQILEKRLSIISLKTPVKVEINETNTEEIIIYTNGSEESERLRELLEPSETFLAFFKLNISDHEKLKLKGNHTVNVESNRISLDDKEIEEGDSTSIDGTEIRLRSIKDGEASLDLIAYSQDDLEGVHQSRSGVTSYGQGGYSYNIQLIVSKEASERVRDISQNYEAKKGRLYRGEKQANLHVYVDNEKLTSLRASSSFQTQLIRQPQISVSAESREEVKRKGERIISILSSGNLPTPLEYKSSGYIEDINSNSTIASENEEQEDEGSEEADESDENQEQIENERSWEEFIEIQDYEKPYGEGNYEEKIIWNASWMSGIVHIRLNRSDNQFDMINRYKDGGTRLNRTLQTQCLLTDLYAHSPKEIVLENYYNKEEFPVDILQDNEPRNVYFEYIIDSENQVIAFCEPNENIDPETSTGDYYYPSSEILIERNY